MRLLLAGLAGFALAVVPALAADHSVQATPGNVFTPATLEVKVGDSVTWTNSGGNHNVHFKDGFDQPADPSPVWSEPVKRTFSATGTYKYWCDAHGSEDTDMAGTIVVKSDDTTGTTTQTTTTGTTTQTTTTTTPTTTTTTPTTTETTTTPPPPPVVSVRATRSSFCVRRSRTCRRPGVVLRITSDTPHRIQGTLRRNGRTFGKVAFDVPAGTRTVRFTRTRTGKRLARGRYSLKLGTAPTVRFRVR